MGSLLLEELRPEGRVAVGEVEDGEVIVGRDPGEGIAINNSAISRNHGVFAHIRGHWFYKDLGSTNGSWHNGVQLKANQWRLVRSGDIIQMADTAIRVGGDDPARAETLVGLPSINARSLIVFSKGDFINEFPVPDFGRALVVGGSNGQLAIEGDLAELPSLVIERRGDAVAAFSLAKEASVSINDRSVSELTNLTDGDEIRVGDYVIMMNDPSALKRREVSVDRLTRSRDPLVAGGGRGAPDRWASEESPAGRSTVRMPFGQTASDDADERSATQYLERPGFDDGGYERHPSMRFSYEEPSSGGWSALEDKVVIGVGFILLVVLMLLVVWWILL